MTITLPSNDDPHRKLWHALVDNAVARATTSGEPFTVEDVLDSIGILRWVPYRAQALTYATKMITAAQAVVESRRAKR
jgi:hypothetical protein